MVLGPLRLPGDGDLYWQRWLGDTILRTQHLPNALGNETFAGAGAPWVPQEWLFSLLVALARDHHVFVVLAVAASAIPLAVLFTIVARARAVASLEAIGIALLFTGMAFTEAFGVRAQVLGWGFFAAFLFFIERRDRWCYAAIPTTIAWANVHASVMLAPAVILARLFAIGSDGGWRALRASRDLFLLPAVSLTLLCTPFGTRLPLYAIALVHSPIRHFIREWQPVGLSDAAFYAGALPLALAIAAGGRTTLLRAKIQALPAALLLVAAVLATRNVPLFAIAAAPLAAVGIDARLCNLAAIPQRLRYLEPVALTAIAFAIALLALSVVQTQRRDPPRLPVAAIAALGADGSQHRLFCEDFTWCSVALNYPRVRVFMDGRCDPYPLPVWKQYVEMVRALPVSQQILQGYGVDSVVANRRGALASRLRSEGAWRVAYTDGAYVVFRRE